MVYPGELENEEIGQFGGNENENTTPSSSKKESENNDQSWENMNVVKVDKKEKVVEKKETKPEPKKEQPKKNEVKEEVKALEELTIEEDDDEEDLREPVNIVFIGHVDAGKSTCSGQFLYLLGMVDERTIQKFQKEAMDMKRGSWFFAYIMDTIEEERSKGITVEVGRAIALTEKKRYTILDAPGHKNFVPNMITGVGQADVAILVISARKGEFEAGFEKNGQTREHALLARTLGVRQLILAINKMDDTSVNWDKKRFDEIKDKIFPYLKSIGYNINKDVIVIPLSGMTGINLKDRVDPKVCGWYEGDSLVGTLDNLPKIARNSTGPVRIPVVDKYKDMGTVVIHGKVEQGVVRKGQQLIAMPSKTMVEVTLVENDLKVLKYANTGENIKLSIKGIDDENIRRGDILCDPSSPIHSATEFVVQLAIHDLPDPKSIFCAGFSCILHSPTAAEEITVETLLAELDMKTQQIKTKLPNHLKSKSLSVVHIRTSQPICLETFKDVPQLGRFTLRSESKTIAFGKVLYLGPPDRKSVV